MGKEQEFRPCPFCGARAEEHSKPLYGYPRIMCGSCLARTSASTIEEARSSWNRRSSDEQAEVVGYVTEDAVKLMREAKPGSGWRYHMFAKDRTDPTASVALYASPPAVAAGGVTEARAIAAEMVARNERNGFLTDWWCKKLDALTATLAVRDEGIRDGWQDISTVPKDGREVVLRVRSRAGVPGGTVVGHYMQGGHCIEDHPPIAAGWYFWGGTSFDLASEPTHWQPLPPPPSRGEGG